MTITLSDFRKEDFNRVCELLAQADLPIADLTSEKCQNFLVAKTEDGLISGVVGMEVYQAKGLLRSFAVKMGSQSRGLGRQLLGALEKKVVQRGVSTLYLLTTTAESYFPRFGYKKMDKAFAPQVIKKTHEFNSMCPESAVCMYKKL